MDNWVGSTFCIWRCGRLTHDIGLGASLSFASIPVPTEIPLARCYPKATRLVCQKLAAGGNISYFVVEKEDIQDGRKTIDLLAVSIQLNRSNVPLTLLIRLVMDNLVESETDPFVLFFLLVCAMLTDSIQWAHAPSPIRVKTISGLLECLSFSLALSRSDIDFTRDEQGLTNRNLLSRFLSSLYLSDIVISPSYWITPLNNLEESTLVEMSLFGVSYVSPLLSLDID